MSRVLSKTAARFKAALASNGFAVDVVALSEATRTAQQAADTIGCSVSQIAKSIVFREPTADVPVLVIASGTNRVDVAKIEAAMGLSLAQADGAFVKKRTGFAIGGVPPAGHREALHTFLDVDLKQYREIWAAAGTPFAVFRLAPADLPAMTGGEWLDVADC